MVLRYATVSSRCAIWVDDKHQLVYVNGKSIQRNDPTLWMFGGGVVTTSEGRRYLESECGAEQFEGDNDKPEDDPNDLRFWLPDSKVVMFEDWLRSSEPGLKIVEAAQRELLEECVNHDLPLDLACKVQFKKPSRIDQERTTWSYKGVSIPRALCYDYIVPGRVINKVAQEIKNVVAASENLYLITRSDVGKHISGMINGKPTQIKVPTICELLF